MTWNTEQAYWRVYFRLESVRWIQRVIWPSVAVLGVHAFRIFPLVHNFLTFQFSAVFTAYNIAPICFAFIRHHMTTLSKEKTSANCRRLTELSTKIRTRFSSHLNFHHFIRLLMQWQSTSLSAVELLPTGSCQVRKLTVEGKTSICNLQIDNSGWQLNDLYVRCN